MGTIVPKLRTHPPIDRTHLYVARWYVRVPARGSKKRIRKYLKKLYGVGRYSWTVDPYKAMRWTIQDATKAHELAVHFQCDVVQLTDGL
jgi:hypothetical protein